MINNCSGGPRTTPKAHCILGNAVPGYLLKMTMTPTARHLPPKARTSRTPSFPGFSHRRRRPRIVLSGFNYIWIGLPPSINTPKYKIVDGSENHGFRIARQTNKPSADLSGRVHSSRREDTGLWSNFSECIVLCMMSKGGLAIIAGSPKKKKRVNCT